MHEPRSMLRLAYEALLSSRNLVRPGGQPLYSYSFSRSEFDATARVLKAVGPDFLHDRHGSALFVVYTAEWFRRIREGGHWDWIHPLQSLNVHYHPTDLQAQVRYADIRAAAEAGLAVWRRTPKRGLSVLYSVIAESGFPAAAVRRGPRLANWLRRSILAIEAGFVAEEAVAAEAWRAPEGLVQILFDAAVSLCRTIVDIRASVPKDRMGFDAVQLLERVRPNWRADLPFDLEEQDVGRLVEDLVRAERQVSQGLEVVRRLRRVDEGWQAFAELSLDGTLDHRRLPSELRAAMHRAGRVRLRPGGALADRSRVLAALDRVTDENQDRWEVRPLVQGCDFRLDLCRDFRLQAIAGEEILAEFTASAGDPIEGPAIALRPPDGAELDELAELLVIGASPAKTPSHWLVLAVEAAALGRLRVEGPQRDLGKLAEGNRTLVAFDGRAELDIGGERLIWRTRDERREALRLNLVGNTLPRIEERIFLGCPNAWVVDEEAAAAVTRRELTWRAIGSGGWTAVTDHEPVGKVELAVRRKGVLVAWTRAEIVPPGFRMDADARTKALRLTGLAGGTVAAFGQKPIPCRREGDTTVVDLVNHPRGALLRLSLRWVTIIELSVPDPLTEPVLLGLDGRPCAAPRLSVGRLPGYRLLSPSPSTLLFELRRMGFPPVYATRTVEGLVPLAAFGELVRQLLGGCEDLDAYVRLIWSGREERVAEIGWYDLDRPLTLPETNSPFASLATILAAPTLLAFSVVEPQGGVVQPQLAPAPMMRGWLAQNLGPGPWLLSGVAEDGQRFRPKVLDEPARGINHVGLQTASRQPTRERRDAALDACLSDTACLSVEELRHLVELVQDACKAEVPYASVDALRALARSPRAAVFALAECTSFVEREAVLRLQSELPTLWCVSPIEDWISAFTARRARLAAKLAEISEAVELADASLARALGEILNLQPALRVHVQAALLLSGAGVMVKPQLTERLKQPSAGYLGLLAQDLIRRHGEGAEPPRTLGLSTVVPSSAALWTRHHPVFADVLAAPLVAAGIAVGEVERASYLPACRSAWLFDPDYFEAAVVGVLFERARS
jgi:hypothetical protein